MAVKLSLLIFLLPLAAFAMLAVTQSFTRRVTDIVATLTLTLCVALSLVVLGEAWISQRNLLGNLTFEWLPLGTGRPLVVGLMVDKLTAIMLVVVTGVSFLVYLFSVKYMHGDVRYGRYYCSLLLFSASMLGLVLANNLLFLFVFWELVGLSSYLLIGHWFEKKSASDAAIKAFITTRIGDVGMFLGLLILYFQVGSLQYADIFAAVQTGQLSGGLRTLAGLGVFLGAMGKSAQFPLHVWLPDAMEGPTPVSALIHAATMVAAGVYLTGRLHPLFDPATLLVIAYVGAFTALFAATIAVVQDDIKKVLAYSTVSQLGYMIMALGVGGYVSGLFHLTTHAFFKAGLFLGAGAVIYAMHHEQSLSKYGGLAKKLPITAVCYLLFTLALTGFPGFSGFWSKDAILADALSFSLEHGHAFIPIAGFVTVLLTAFYMFRQYLLTFAGKPRDHHAYEHAKEVPWQMYVPLIILAFLSVTAGGFGKWFGSFNPKLDGAQQVLEFTSGMNALSVAQEAAGHLAHAGGHSAHGMAMILSTILALSGIALGFLFYFPKRDGSTVFNPASVVSRMRGFYLLLVHKYYLDELYDRIIVKPVLSLAGSSARFDRAFIDKAVDASGQAGIAGATAVEATDRVVIDGYLVNGTACFTGQAGEQISVVQTGYIRHYLLSMVIGVVVVAVVCIWVSLA